MTNKKQDPRSPMKKRKDAAYARLPAAIIFKPLRFIGEHTNKLVDDFASGGKRVELSIEYLAAKDAAKSGDGAYVKRMARSVALSV